MLMGQRPVAMATPVQCLRRFPAILVVMGVGLILGCAANSTSDSPLLASSMFSDRPLASLLPSETLLMSMGPTASLLVSSNSLSPSEVLHTLTPSPAFTAGFESSWMLMTSQQWFATSEPVHWGPSSVSFTVHPSPSIISTDVVMSASEWMNWTGPRSTHSVDGGASTAEAGLVSITEMMVPTTAAYVLETSSITGEMWSDSSYTLQPTPSGWSPAGASSSLDYESLSLSTDSVPTPSLSYDPMPSSDSDMGPSMSMSSLMPTPSASMLMPSTSGLPVSSSAMSLQPTSEFPMSATVDNTVPTPSLSYDPTPSSDLDVSLSVSVSSLRPTPSASMPMVSTSGLSVSTGPESSVSMSPLPASSDPTSGPPSSALPTPALSTSGLSVSVGPEPSLSTAPLSTSADPTSGLPSSALPTPALSTSVLASSAVLNGTLPWDQTTPSAVSSTVPTLVPSEATLPPGLVSVKCTVTLKGDCVRAKRDKVHFAAAFAAFVADMLETDVRRLTVQGIRCGSVLVDFVLRDSDEEALAEDLAIRIGEGDVGFEFGGENFTATSAAVDPVDPTRKPGGDGGGLTFEEQQRLIYIVIGSAAGLVLLLALLLLVHHRIRRACSERAQSFDVGDEPRIKLSDFNMAHTFIPRPRSIYGAWLGADGRYHHGNGSLHRGQMRSPTPYVYADDQAIREHYHEVVAAADREPTSATSRTSVDFGRSGVPRLNLPRLEGVHRAGEEDDASDDQLLRPLSTRRGSVSSTNSRLSATFHGPPEPAQDAPPALDQDPPSHDPAPPNDLPPPPPPPPPPPSPPPSPGPDPPTLDLPPPPPLPPGTPLIVQRSPSSLPSSARASQASSSSSNSSSSTLEPSAPLHDDTNSLLYKGCDYDPPPQGIDNPGYERCDNDEPGQAEQAARAPSFYRMTPPPIV